MGLRISKSVKIGPFRLRVSAPIGGRGRTWASVSTRTPLGRISLSEPAGRRKRRAR